MIFNVLRIYGSITDAAAAVVGGGGTCRCFVIVC